MSVRKIADDMATKLRLESMSDEQLESFLNEDPPARRVLDKWPDADLDRLAKGDAATTRRFDSEVSQERLI